MEKQENFKMILLNDKYILWLSNYMTKEKNIDDLYFLSQHKSEEEMLEYLKYLYAELQSYYIKNINKEICVQDFCMKYKNNYYNVGYSGECFYCKISNNLKSTCEYIEYESLKNQYSMEEWALSNDINITRLDKVLDKIINNTQEFYTKVSENLTSDERLLILLSLKNKNCDTCTFKYNCNFEAYDVLYEMEKINDSDCKSWFNSELIGKSKVLRINDINKLKN